MYAAADPSLGERVARAQRLLQLLEWLPDAEPPADLVNKTLRLVEQPARKAEPLPSLLSGQRPVA